MPCKLAECHCFKDPGVCPNWEDRRHTNWMLGWVDRRRHELKQQLAAVDKSEAEIPANMKH